VEEEVADLRHELRPGGFVLEQDVVAALERHEPRSGDRHGEEPPLPERDDGIATCMQDERGDADARKERGDVDLADGAGEADRVLGRRALAL
jgi:hypothetical protein